MTSPAAAAPPPLFGRGFWTTALFVGVWINLSEVARYFLVVRPMILEAFPALPGAAPINPTVFASWMVWDAILILGLVAAVWTHLERRGASAANAVAAASFVWVMVFVILWLGLLNLGFATPAMLAAALPWAWVELAAGGLIVLWGVRRVASAEPD